MADHEKIIEKIEKWKKERFTPMTEEDSKREIRSVDWSNDMLPVHDQQGKNNCTSHAIAGRCELELINHFNESVSIDVDQLWANQLRYGTATEEEGDSLAGVLYIADEYGMHFETKSGIKGIYWPKKGIELVQDNKTKSNKYGSVDVNSKNISNKTVNKIVNQEYEHAKSNRLFSYLIILIGILLIILNITGVVSFEIEVLGMKGKILDASPGIFIVFCGLIYSFINHPKVKVR